MSMAAMRRSRGRPPWPALRPPRCSMDLSPAPVGLVSPNYFGCDKSALRQCVQAFGFANPSLDQALSSTTVRWELRAVATRQRRDLSKRLAAGAASSLFVAAPQRWFISPYVRFHLGAVCGAGRRWKDRARQRAAGDRKSPRAARKRTCRAAARAQVVLAGLAVWIARG